MNCKTGPIDKLFSLVRIVGAITPVSAMFVQLQAEIDAQEVNRRLSALEDPVSQLHPSIPEISKSFYHAIVSQNDNQIRFSPAFYTENSRALAVLESQGLIKGQHAVGKSFALGLTIIDPMYMLYIARLNANKKDLEHLIDVVDSCSIGNHLKASEIQKTINLPTPFIRAIFELYDSKGFGLLSRELGVDPSYCAIA